ncbi:F0F1 ATP synthase subunit epsilon [Bacteroides sp. 224]|uniref:F0F1 ATP synthase subunit epsilon n=1 Tax=Bacteroides sp. 224 TaxID=2302936 RepID=UPI0013D56833|nr:F0F1 ATP synthase subunit epsilon [Bacteroides sp. 224]NDV65157.1 F0F1 ATP synthase subunit epsilon [Bacteroides sp. 224]
MREHTFHLTIVSPAKQLFDGEATRITVPGSAGEFTILAHHAAIVSSLTKGTLTYEASGKEEKIEIQGGFVEMSNGVASVCIS